MKWLKYNHLFYFWVVAREGSIARACDELLIVGEFDDSALLKIFDQTGAGLFASPSVIEAEVRRQYRVQVIGRLTEVRERFYAISAERKLKHPAVVVISA